MILHTKFVDPTQAYCMQGQKIHQQVRLEFQNIITNLVLLVYISGYANIFICAESV